VSADIRCRHRGRGAVVTSRSPGPDPAATKCVPTEHGPPAREP
jgi:hypothetical protein